MIQCIDDDHGSTLTRDVDAGPAVQTNLGGQVALSDSNFVPCPRNLPREPWKMSKQVQATPTLSLNCSSSPYQGYRVP